MATTKQVAANQLNAQKSTGPTSAEGKRKVSGNRISHGILSNKLLVNGEQAEQYTALLDDLFTQFDPVGAVEQSLVEKIAISLWRQRRLIAAETATIDLAKNPTRVARGVESGMGLAGYGSETIAPEDLLPPDKEKTEQLEWCKSVIAEQEKLSSMDPGQIEESAPIIYEQIARDADDEEMTASEYLTENDLGDYVLELAIWCRKEIAEFERRMSRYPAVAAACAAVNDKFLVPWEKLDVLSKYQTTLDNQLYKALKALREAQEWRLSSIDGVSDLEKTCDAA